MTQPMIELIVAHHEGRGRGACAMISWLQDQAGRLAGLSGSELEDEEEAIRAEMIAREDWHRSFSQEGIINASRNYDEPRASRVGNAYAAHILTSSKAAQVATAMLSNDGSLITLPSGTRTMMQAFLETQT